MEATQKEREILRELARKYAEVAALERNLDIRQRMRDLNDLKPVRPIVLMDEIPWHELNAGGRLTNVCETPFAAGMETFFRRALLQWEYFPCDRLFENYYPLAKTVHIEGMPDIRENTLAVDERNNIVSHAFHDQLKDESDLEKLGPPVVNIDKALDAEREGLAADILDGILPVRMTGVELYYAPWDVIPRLHGGVTQVYFDLVDRPEFMHAIIKRFTDNQLVLMKEYERLGLLDAETTLIHCTPALCSDRPAKDYDGGAYRLKDVWFRSMAQMFSDVSPDQHEEFDLEYSRPFFEMCRLGYYGCCEPLDRRLDKVMKLPNLRKLGVSPWANLDVCGEKIGSGYVFARKPNPANVAIKTDPEVVREELLKTVEVCKRYDCRWEYVLKDISTAGGDINNLMVWEQTVMKTLDEYYG